MDEQKSRLLATELRTITTRLIKKLRKKSATGQNLSLTTRSTIALLDQHQRLLPSELAAMEKITTQSMSQILNNLAELNLINRETSATDKRKVYISLSEAGAEKLHQVRHERDEWLHKAIIENCTAEEQELISKALVALARIVEFE